jgi:hypothetical protein
LLWGRVYCGGGRIASGGPAHLLAEVLKPGIWSPTLSAVLEVSDKSSTGDQESIGRSRSLGRREVEVVRKSGMANHGFFPCFLPERQASGAWRPRPSRLKGLTATLWYSTGDGDMDLERPWQEEREKGEYEGLIGTTFARDWRAGHLIAQRWSAMTTTG